jgi:hypothetical protein
MSENEGCRTWSKIRPRSIRPIPREVSLIGNMILENAAKDRPDVVFDLDRRTAHGLDFGLLHTD